MLSNLSYSIIFSIFLFHPQLEKQDPTPVSTDIIIVIDDLIGSHSTPEPDFCSFSDFVPYFILTPNPCSSKANLLVDPDDGDILELDIYDLEGELKASTTQSEGNWYVPSLTSGLYRFQIITTKGCSSRLWSIN